jgi:sugar phosphate isomerase/epimerase
MRQESKANGAQLDRREALHLAALGVAGACLGTAAPRVARAMDATQVPIGLELYSVRDDCARDLPKTLAAVARMGYAGVEFAGYHGRSAVELRQLLDDNGLRCCGTHTALDTLLGDELARTIDFNQTLGNRFLIVPWIAEERRRTLQQWKATAALFSELAEKAGSRGLRVGYHNHSFELGTLEGEGLWDAFFGTTSPKVVMQVDVGNCLAGGGDPLAILKRYPGRALTIHVKEFSRTDPGAFVGEGQVDWPSLFQVCESTGGTEWYIVEYEHESQPALTAVARCLANLRKLGK